MGARSRDNLKWLIFSDESGKWNRGDYYIRSWVKISRSHYRHLRKEVLFLKHELRLKELKWKIFRGNYKCLMDIFSVSFDVFVTISIPSRFLAQEFRVLKTLANLSDDQFSGRLQLRQKLREKAISSVKNVLFFNIYERQHIENAIAALAGSLAAEDYKLTVDSPQHLKKEWIEIAKSIGVKNVEVEEHSEREPGIEVADIVAGCTRGMVENDGEAKKIYRLGIKNKMLDMTSTAYPNPNLIFYRDFDDAERKRLNIFR